MFDNTTIKETEKDFKIFIKASGFSKDDLKINFEKDLLSVFGIKEIDSLKLKVEKYIEISSDLFEIEKINANMKDGLLIIEVPKKEKIIPKSISIN